MLNDEDIVQLYWNRHESAIEESSRRYGRYCYAIAHNILHNSEDAEECVNDTWLRTWNTIPPQRPSKLAFFVGRITRNLSLDKYKAQTAKKRGGHMRTLMEQLTECIPAPVSTQVEQTLSEQQLNRTINQFMHTLPERECNLFLARYWYGMSLTEMAQRFGMKENNIKASLFRSRGKLKRHLLEEGIEL
ncbi:sigma-70 family RNA polymerase sigma factor [Paenibacillus campi]|uniref:RNA polymerase sigma factor n=1 Tax=Paenibacillus campi TaxID=3106031 RepID=UPI002AFFF09D|nr:MULTISPECIES: sigma-70 family RNA polymerase sigma factor [unclassified Paenibacillus]